MDEFKVYVLYNFIIRKIYSGVVSHKKTLLVLKCFDCHIVFLCLVGELSVEVCVFSCSVDDNRESVQIARYGI